MDYFSKFNDKMYSAVPSAKNSLVTGCGRSSHLDYCLLQRDSEIILGLACVGLGQPLRRPLHYRIQYNYNGCTDGTLHGVCCGNWVLISKSL